MRKRNNRPVALKPTFESMELRVVPAVVFPLIPPVAEGGEVVRESFGVDGSTTRLGMRIDTPAQSFNETFSMQIDRNRGDARRDLGTDGFTASHAIDQFSRLLESETGATGPDGVQGQTGDDPNAPNVSQADARFLEGPLGNIAMNVRLDSGAYRFNINYNLTIRQLYTQLTAGGFTVIGTAADIADVMQEWFEAGACDGFNVLPTHLPVACEDFVELITPELQRRGLFRTAYEGGTLRENLGLPPHVNRHTAARQAAE